MTHIVQFANNEQITLDDLNDIGVSSRQTFDYLTRDAIDNSLKFAGFPITQASQAAITVGAGRIYQAGAQFSNEDAGGVAVNLINYLPAINGNTKIVSIVAYGLQQDSQGVARTFLTNSATQQTEANNVSTQNVRVAVVAPSPGVEAPSPVPPPVSANQCEVARVVLGYSGIIAITYVEDNRLQTVTGLDTRAKSLENWRVQAGAQLDTIRSDIANLANSIVGLPSPAIFQQVVNTLSQVQAKAKIPAAAINFHFDYLLSSTASSSDPSIASYLCRVHEGIRFPWAAQALGILQLLNPIDPKVKANSATKLMLPDYNQVARIDTMGNDGNISLSQSQYQNIVATQKSISRQVVSMGASQTVCTNSLFWQTGVYDPITGIFTRNGETYQVAYTGQAWRGQTAHESLRLTQFSVSTMTDTYTDYSTVTVNVNGSTKSQTFLNSQAGWLTSIDLAFAQVAPTGDVTVLITETTNGAPDFKRVLTSTQVAASNLKVWPQTTRFELTSTYLDPGERYAIVLVTPGNHFVCYVNNNKYAQGSLFDSTDGAFSQGDLFKDLAFRANFAKFTTAVCQVQMKPLQLENGITDIKLLYGSKVPDGCQLNWEIQKDGIWYPLKSYADTAVSNPLLGLPPLLPLRVTFVGTTDIMPGIDMMQTETRVGRPGANYQHWSLPINIGVASSNIRVEATVDAFDPTYHTVGSSLLINGSIVAPTAVSTQNDPNGKVDRFIKVYTYSLGSATSSFRIGINGTTSAVTKTYHVESRFDYES